MFGGKGDFLGFRRIPFFHRKSGEGEESRSDGTDAETDSNSDSDSNSIEFVDDDDMSDFGAAKKTTYHVAEPRNGQIRFEVDFHSDDDEGVSSDRGSKTVQAQPVQYEGEGEDALRHADSALPNTTRIATRKQIILPKDSIPAAGADAAATDSFKKIPPLSIAILVCGTRGDVQPFIVLALKLKEYGHKVRLATHAVYREFVQKYGIDFYPMGGDPKILSEFVVKNGGIFTLNTKDAMASVAEVKQVVYSCYAACTEADPEDEQKRPFVAEAIIANPPSYGHIHVAEKLQVPLHIYFTMPWTPTKSFPHPLAHIKNVKDKRPRSIGLRNLISYSVVGEFTYAGLFGIFNSFREEILNLEPIRLGNNGSSLLNVFKVPFSYVWSPSFIPKTPDWPDYVDVTGYLFLDESKRNSFEPDEKLLEFLEAGEPPVFFGFGSMAFEKPERLAKIILESAEEVGVRVLISSGWANLGEGMDLPPTAFRINDTPHDWLFPKCAAVVHHGGAGTVAAGLSAACPTLVVPFFGDQQFWGSAVFHRGVGPRAVDVDRLTKKKLVAALTEMKGDGAANAVESFHRALPDDYVKNKTPVVWDLARPQAANMLHEVLGGLAGIAIEPIDGALTGGVKGAVKGVFKGFSNVILRPIKGLDLLGHSVVDSHKHQN